MIDWSAIVKSLAAQGISLFQCDPTELIAAKIKWHGGKLLEFRVPKGHSCVSIVFENAAPLSKTICVHIYVCGDMSDAADQFMDAAMMELECHFRPDEVLAA